MANDYSSAAVHQINRWLWSVLKVENAGEFTKFLTPGSPTNGMVPIIPSQQLPELTNIAGGAPFMIYNYSIEPQANVWEKREQIGYVIYDDNEYRLRTIHNKVVQLLGRMDWAAADVNRYLSSVDPNNEFDFKWLQVNSAAGPQPFESENGRHGALIMLTVSYTREMYGDPSLLGQGLGMRS